ncbi:hypothetical protein C4546_02085 [Candidatus Parcubacteria bacterium]|jgi:hypothetical protein|nr:MAG: hypothetical protein C4546_02085 [Candidatus Parcubacteria bacterium]
MFNAFKNLTSGPGKIVLTGFILGGLLFACQSASAAILYISPENDSISQGQTAVFEVRLDSEKQVVNAIQARVVYDPNVLEFVEAAKWGSFLSLWPEIPKADIAAGVITFAGGIPNGSYVINGKVLSLVFKAKTLGQTQVSIDSGTSGVYLNDGLGTKTPLTTKPGKLEIKIPASTLNLTSTTHPDENEWYKARDVKFSWRASQGAIYAFTFGPDPAALPDLRFGSAVGEASYSNVDEGVQYFILRERLPNDDWGEPMRVRAQIDASQPEPISAQLARGVIEDKLTLVFNATDHVSEVVRYSILEGDEFTENAASPYVLLDQKQRRDITITAYDAAGNFITTTILGVKAQIWDWRQILLIVSSVVLAAAVLWIRYKIRKKAKAKIIANH